MRYVTSSRGALSIRVSRLALTGASAEIRILGVRRFFGRGVTFSTRKECRPRSFREKEMGDGGNGNGY